MVLSGTGSTIVVKFFMALKKNKKKINDNDSSIIIVKGRTTKYKEIPSIPT